MKEQPSAAMPETGLEIPLPSGAVFPDWSVVASATVRASLNATLGVLRMAKKWPGMGADEERVRLAVLTHYAEAGNAPSHGRLSKITGFEPDQIVRLLEKLEVRDLVVLNQDGQGVIGAYPFTEANTGHRIRLGDKTLNAMCAIDALGAGAMLGVDAVIDSACRRCGRAIHVETRDKGRGIESVSPEGAVVWSGVREIDGCAADTQCTVMAFFCSDDHLNGWRRDDPAGAEGHRLSMDEGLQAGMAIFLPFLARDDGPSTE
ncbi:MAG: alkylmercury lyase family protein [Proteobacteria bacterium]|nr:alkylmercury lyase family protein [Pseudomonadota bacterium]